MKVFNDDEVTKQLLSRPALSEWTYNADTKAIHKTFNFKGYYKTIAFVNASAWISQDEGHHPDLEVGYNKVVVKYSTHEAGGITNNDFICAEKIEGLFS